MNKKKYLMRPFVGEEELEYVKRGILFKSKCLTEGPVTYEFEKKFAEYVEAKHDNRSNVMCDRTGTCVGRRVGEDV